MVENLALSENRLYQSNAYALAGLAQQVCNGRVGYRIFLSTGISSTLEADSIAVFFESCWVLC
jgi:hypothetical protein